MSQQPTFLSISRDPSRNRPGIERLLPTVVVLLGVVAPLLLVLGVDLVTTDALLRAHRIVQGCTVLALSLGGTAFASVLYALGVHEAQLLALPLTPRLDMTNA